MDNINKKEQDYAIYIGLYFLGSFAGLIACHIVYGVNNWNGLIFDFIVLLAVWILSIKLRLLTRYFELIEKIYYTIHNAIKR